MDWMWQIWIYLAFALLIDAQSFPRQRIGQPNRGQFSNPRWRQLHSRNRDRRPSRPADRREITLRQPNFRRQVSQSLTHQRTFNNGDFRSNLLPDGITNRQMLHTRQFRNRIPSNSRAQHLINRQRASRDQNNNVFQTEFSNRSVNPANRARLFERNGASRQNFQNHINRVRSNQNNAIADDKNADQRHQFRKTTQDSFQKTNTLSDFGERRENIIQSAGAPVTGQTSRTGVMVTNNTPNINAVNNVLNNRRLSTRINVLSSSAKNSNDAQNSLRHFMMNPQGHFRRNGISVNGQMQPRNSDDRQMAVNDNNGLHLSTAIFQSEPMLPEISSPNQVPKHTAKDNTPKGIPIVALRPPQASPPVVLRTPQARSNATNFIPQDLPSVINLIPQDPHNVKKVDTIVSKTGISFVLENNVTPLPKDPPLGTRHTELNNLEDHLNLHTANTMSVVSSKQKSSNKSVVQSPTDHKTDLYQPNGNKNTHIEFGRLSELSHSLNTDERNFRINTNSENQQRTSQTKRPFIARSEDQHRVNKLNFIETGKLAIEPLSPKEAFYHANERKTGFSNTNHSKPKIIDTRFTDEETRVKQTDGKIALPLLTSSENALTQHSSAGNIVVGDNGKENVWLKTPMIRGRVVPDTSAAFVNNGKENVWQKTAMVEGRIVPDTSAAFVNNGKENVWQKTAMVKGRFVPETSAAFMNNGKENVWRKAAMVKGRFVPDTSATFVISSAKTDIDHMPKTVLKEINGTANNEKSTSTKLHSDELISKHSFQVYDDSAIQRKTDNKIVVSNLPSTGRIMSTGRIGVESFTEANSIISLPPFVLPPTQTTNKKERFRKPFGRIGAGRFFGMVSGNYPTKYIQKQQNSIESGFRSKEEPASGSDFQGRNNSVLNISSIWDHSPAQKKKINVHVPSYLSGLISDNTVQKSNRLNLMQTSLEDRFSKINAGQASQTFEHQFTPHSKTVTQGDFPRGHFATISTDNTPSYESQHISNTLITDPFQHQLISDLNVPVMPKNEIHHNINGEYTSALVKSDIDHILTAQTTTPSLHLQNQNEVDTIAERILSLLLNTNNVASSLPSTPSPAIETNTISPGAAFEQIAASFANINPTFQDSIIQTLPRVRNEVIETKSMPNFELTHPDTHGPNLPHTHDVEPFVNGGFLFPASLQHTEPQGFSETYFDNLTKTVNDISVPQFTSGQLSGDLNSGTQFEQSGIISGNNLINPGFESVSHLTGHGRADLEALNHQFNIQNTAPVSHQGDHLGSNVINETRQISPIDVILDAVSILSQQQPPEANLAGTYTPIIDDKSPTHLHNFETTTPQSVNIDLLNTVVATNLLTYTHTLPQSPNNIDINDTNTLITVLENLLLTNTPTMDTMPQNKIGNTKVNSISSPSKTDAVVNSQLMNPHDASKIVLPNLSEVDFGITVDKHMPYELPSSTKHMQAPILTKAKNNMPPVQNTIDGAANDTSVLLDDLLAGLQLLLIPDTISTTIAPSTTTKQREINPGASITSCSPDSSSFYCKGKGMFNALETMSTWCVGMCKSQGCVETVCECGCRKKEVPVLRNIKKWNKRRTRVPKKQQRRKIQKRNKKLWMRKKRKQNDRGRKRVIPTTQEPPEEEEVDAEDMITTTAVMPSTTEMYWDDSSTIPPYADIQLQQVEQGQVRAEKIHLTEIPQVEWASELKARLSKLAKNAANLNEPAGWKDNPPTTAMPYMSTSWEVAPTPASTKPPPTRGWGRGWRERRPRDRWDTTTPSSWNNPPKDRWRDPPHRPRDTWRDGRSQYTPPPTSGSWRDNQQSEWREQRGWGSDSRSRGWDTPRSDRRNRGGSDHEGYRMRDRWGNNMRDRWGNNNGYQRSSDQGGEGPEPSEAPDR